MSIDNIFGIASTAMNAQLVRMNTTASNLANAGTVAESAAKAFKAKRPIFQALVDQEMITAGAQYKGGVKVAEIMDDTAVNLKVHDPGNPKADKDGFVYNSNVNEVTEMVEMMNASRSYQNNVEVVNTAKELLMKTLDVLKS